MFKMQMIVNFCIKNGYVKCNYSKNIINDLQHIKMITFYHFCSKVSLLHIVTQLVQLDKQLNDYDYCSDRKLCRKYGIVFRTARGSWFRQHLELYIMRACCLYIGEMSPFLLP